MTSGGTSTARGITASLRGLFPHVDMRTTGNPDGTWTLTLPARSAETLGLGSGRVPVTAEGASVAAGRISRHAGMPLVITGTRWFRRRDCSSAVAVTLAAGGSE